jgi:hypothetical protein
VFTEMDADGSGYLDEDEVMKAVAMLGFAVDKANLVRNGQTQDKTRQDKHKTGNKSDAFRLRKNCAIGRFCGQTNSGQTGECREHCWLGLSGSRRL